MSCPKAGDPSVRKASTDLEKAFYTVRAGAYDNTPLAADLGAGNMSVSEQNQRLRAGIAVSGDFLSTIGRMYDNLEPATIQRAVQGHPAIQSKNLTMALVYEQRSHHKTSSGGEDLAGFTYDANMQQALLDNLTTSTIASRLANTSNKVSTFATLDPSMQSIEGSISFGQNETDREIVRRSLASGLDLVLGYMEPAGDLRQLQSPDADPYKTINGRGYRMNFSLQSAEGLTAPVATMVTSIEEMDMSKKPLVSLTSSQSQQWSCFSLRIVREIDRLDPCTHRPYTTPGLHDKYNCINGVISGTRVANVHAACPTQTTDSLNAKVAENGRTYQKNALRLKMARRSLPAELWQVNTDPSFMCAVPNEKALASGGCYATGDSDSTINIQYDLQDPVRGGCGASHNANECPAYVSICYRNQ